jgi:hypothetical protein
MSTIVDIVSRACPFTQSSSCQPGAYYSSAAIMTDDRACTPCAPGTYSPSSTPSTLSTATSTTCAFTQSAFCAPGTYFAADASAVEDRTCVACPAGFFAAMSSASDFGTPVVATCASQQSQQCGTGTYYSAPATLTGDRTCSTCHPGTWPTGRRADGRRQRPPVRPVRPGQLLPERDAVDVRH